MNPTSIVIMATKKKPFQQAPGAQVGLRPVRE